MRNCGRCKRSPKEDNQALIFLNQDFTSTTVRRFSANLNRYISSSIPKSLKGTKIKRAINQLRCLNCEAFQIATPFQNNCHIERTMTSTITTGCGIPFT